MTISSRRFRISTGLMLLGAMLLGCTDAYMPDVVSAPPSYLVVDGYINPQGISTFKLTHTYAIASAAAAPVEARATVYIEEEGGLRYTLREAPTGTYTSVALALNPTKKYRLHLNTTGGKEYASDYVPVKTTPPIDNLGWRIDNGDLNIYVNAHDATNATRFYRWDFDETWEIRPPYGPNIEYVNPVIRPLAVPLPSICWGTEASKSVLIDKTTSLTQDVVADHALRVIATNTDRLYTRYSILVRQYALTQEEYAYWELLRKNTESIGTLFDPQPAQLTGNVHCLSNASDLALGFVGAHSVTERRLFIARADLPSSWPRISGYEQCLPPDTVDLYPRNIIPIPKPADILFAAFATHTLLPIDQISDSRGNPIAYTAKTKDCVDCRTRGTAVRPSFW